MWKVYILESINSSFIYIGSTNDLNRRLAEHNRKLVQSTKAFAPYKLRAYVAVETETHARELERYFKTGSGKSVLYKRILRLSPSVNEASA